MKTIYEITIKISLKNSTAFQRIHDLLQKNNIRYWTYDIQRLLLVVRSELHDPGFLRRDLTSSGTTFSFVNVKRLQLGV